MHRDRKSDTCFYLVATGTKPRNKSGREAMAQDCSEPGTHWEQQCPVHHFSHYPSSLDKESMANTDPGYYENIGTKFSGISHTGH